MSVISKLGSMLWSQRLFEFFQKLGIHVTANHFFSPIPDTNVLAAKRELWDEELELVGIDLNIKEQLHFLDHIFPLFIQECNFPLDKTPIAYEYYVKNGSFGLVSAAVLHCMIRHFRPRMIIEVGSGFSTYVSARASLKNKADGQATKLIAIEPHPNSVLEKGFPGLSQLIAKNVEEVPIDFFAQLEEGDILFIDSSHVVRMGGDVIFLYLEILPRLKKEVIVHIHDIFFPKHYPEDWVIHQRRFWNEQYLLQAFLTFNERFKILWSGSYVYQRYKDKLISVFAPPEDLGFHEDYFSSSFWMKRIA